MNSHNIAAGNKVSRYFAINVLLFVFNLVYAAILYHQGKYSNELAFGSQWSQVLPWILAKELKGNISMSKSQNPYI